jgi:uncharacterized protein (DUF1330 family)
MPAYLVVAVTSHDTGWTEAYRRDVPSMVAAHGGRYLARAVPPLRLEGDGPIPDTLAVLEFPTLADAHSLLESAAYRPYLDARQAATSTVMYALEG